MPRLTNGIVIDKNEIVRQFREGGRLDVLAQQFQLPIPILLDILREDYQCYTRQLRQLGERCQNDDTLITLAKLRVAEVLEHATDAKSILQAAALVLRLIAPAAPPEDTSKEEPKGIEQLRKLLRGDPE